VGHRTAPELISALWVPIMPHIDIRPWYLSRAALLSPQVLLCTWLVLQGGNRRLGSSDLMLYGDAGIAQYIISRPRRGVIIRPKHSLMRLRFNVKVAN